MKVELIDHMGTDLTVVNAARVSYAKHSDQLNEKDKNLIHYLAANNHWTPFAHPQLTFRITASIAVARQLYRHQVGLVVNEVSRRYVTEKPTYSLPNFWRSKPEKGQSKQGSGKPLENQDDINEGITHALSVMRRYYEDLLHLGVAPEQARLVLPMITDTEWYWTGSLMAFIRVYLERITPNAQEETREVVHAIGVHLRNLFPHSTHAWGLPSIPS